jgi:hypothetical protein
MSPAGMSKVISVQVQLTGPCASCFERRKKKKKEEHFCIGHACHGSALTATIDSYHVVNNKCSSFAQVFQALMNTAADTD